MLDLLYNTNLYYQKCTFTINTSNHVPLQLTDLSKVFHWVDQKLTIPKFNAYCFRLSAWRLIHDCLSKWKIMNQNWKLVVSWLQIAFGAASMVDIRTTFIQYYLQTYFSIWRVWILSILLMKIHLKLSQK